MVDTLTVINGNVGIETIAPQATLDVNGMVRVETLPPNGGTPVCSNTVSGVTSILTICGSSSRRFKEQIADMGDSSSKLFQLRPVTFFYKPQYDDGSHLLQYGLIAEEVAQLYPEMVGYDKDGQPSSVRYQLLAPMLLNELQKQNLQLQRQAEAIQLQQEQNRKLEDRLAALEARLSGQGSATAKPF
jgi:hypothetical protein